MTTETVTIGRVVSCVAYLFIELNQWDPAQAYFEWAHSRAHTCPFAHNFAHHCETVLRILGKIYDAIINILRPVENCSVTNMAQGRYWSVLSRGFKRYEAHEMGEGGGEKKVIQAIQEGRAAGRWDGLFGMQNRALLVMIWTVVDRFVSKWTESARARHSGGQHFPYKYIV